MKDQIIMQGIVTEADIVRAYMSKLGKIGGSKRSAAQIEAHRRVMQAINERKRERKRQNEHGN